MADYYVNLSQRTYVNATLVCSVIAHVEKTQFSISNNIAYSLSISTLDSKHSSSQVFNGLTCSSIEGAKALGCQTKNFNLKTNTGLSCLFNNFFSVPFYPSNIGYYIYNTPPTSLYYENNQNNTSWAAQTQYFYPTFGDILQIAFEQPFSQAFNLGVNNYRITSNGLTYVGSSGIGNYPNSTLIVNPSIVSTVFSQSIPNSLRYVENNPVFSVTGADGKSTIIYALTFNNPSLLPDSDLIYNSSFDSDTIHYNISFSPSLSRLPFGDFRDTQFLAVFDTSYNQPNVIIIDRVTGNYKWFYVSNLTANPRNMFVLNDNLYSAEYNRGDNKMYFYLVIENLTNFFNPNPNVNRFAYHLQNFSRPVSLLGKYKT